MLMALSKSVFMEVIIVLTFQVPILNCEVYFTATYVTICLTWMIDIFLMLMALSKSVFMEVIIVLTFQVPILNCEVYFTGTYVTICLLKGVTHWSPFTKWDMQTVAELHPIASSRAAASSPCSSSADSLDISRTLWTGVLHRQLLTRLR